MPRYLIGIDLGTTNSALAYFDLSRPPRPDGRVDIQPFAVPQLVAPAEVRDRPLLPSFLYLPGPHDLPAGSTALPWDANRDFVVGEFARNHGGKIPGRLVASAKSWLCHSGVDRGAPLLPWSGLPDVTRVSPVEASSRFLRHFVESWNHSMARGDTSKNLENQLVVLTVPASFDDVARTLTMEAAAKAGLNSVILLEEPQAAFYCWLATHPPAELAHLKPGARCLVVDVGGGTTDFSLIEAVEEKGELGFIRQAVGDHLLLGGDNMDLALAKFLEAKLPQAGRLDAVQYSLLTQGCRQAKELLLSPHPPEKQTVTVVGRGRAVIGGSMHASLSPEDVRQVLLDGFFPFVGREDAPRVSGRAGLHEMGLPYVGDAAITRHLTAFLHHQRKSESVEAPDAILFNGGVFQPEILRNRLLNVMKSWYGASWTPVVLTNPSLDLAVALGAAFYGWLRHTGGKRIGGGIPRSYYVAIEGKEKSSETLDVVCVVPQHLEEGQEVSLDKPVLELALGQPVAFPLYSSTVRGEDQPGAVLQLSRNQLLTLPPLHTVLRGGKRSGTKRVPVTLAARLSAIGTMELFCVAREGENRWKLEFNIRELVREAPAARDDVEDSTGGVTEVWLETQMAEAAQAIRTCYREGGFPPPELPKRLESALESPRAEWPMGLCRRLWDYLAEVSEQRRSSPAHLSRWYNLVGHCLRPGFGDSLDRHRIEQLWKMLATPPRSPGSVTAPRAAEGGADQWIMWRRVAGGLNGAVQQNLFDRLRPVLLPAKGRQVMKPNPHELAEMWRAAASFERLPTVHKESLGNALLKPLQRSPVPTYGFWAMTRLGARRLIYGPLNTVVHHQTAEKWLESLLTFQPGHESERLGWAFCLSQLARRTGQRAIDVDDRHQQDVLTVLRGMQVPPHWVQMVEEVTELEGEEQAQMLGDALPIGLRLLPADNSGE
ncbi:MAG: Hsp70 family protein [Gemmataceae bacterium]